MFVSIFADFSLDHKTMANGFGAYIKSDRGSFKYSGNLKVRTRNTTDGELFSCVNALYLALYHGVCQKGDTVLIQNDCKGAVQKIKKGYSKKLRQMCRENNLKVTAKHVKGHSGYDTKRTAANEICDDLAKNAMRQQREELTNLLRK